MVFENATSAGVIGRPQAHSSNKRAIIGRVSIDPTKAAIAASGKGVNRPLPYFFLTNWVRITMRCLEPP